MRHQVSYSDNYPERTPSEINMHIVKQKRAMWGMANNNFNRLSKELKKHRMEVLRREIDD